MDGSSGNPFLDRIYRDIFGKDSRHRQVWDLWFRATIENTGSKGLREVEALLSQDPDNYDYLCVKSQGLAVRKRFTEALSVANTAIRVYAKQRLPAVFDEVKAHDARERALFSLRRYDDALGAC